MRGLLMGALAAFALSGCASTPRAFPKIDEGDSPPLVVAGKVVDVRWLPQFPECFDPEIICMDSPPFELVIEVRSVVYGKLSANRVIAATTSHYGARMYHAQPQPLRLFHLVTDGEDYVMPRYENVPLVRDVKGVPLLPVLGRGIDSWLPCEIVEARQPAEFPASLQYDRSPWKDDDPELLVIDGDTVRPLTGISLPDLRAWFAKTRPTPAAMECRM